MPELDTKNSREHSMERELTQYLLFFPSRNHLLHLTWGLAMTNFYDQLESRIAWNHPEVRLQGLLPERFKGKPTLSVSNTI